MSVAHDACRLRIQTYRDAEKKNIAMVDNHGEAGQ
jgi:hypothetical protein